ncbi:TcpD family membrane protein, partial [Enterococcus faecium]|nr:TcpD family membrane protein [Enterococcus faecium]
MTLKGIVDFILTQGGYFLIMVVVYLGLRNFMKSKVGNALISIAAGAAVYF